MRKIYTRHQRDNTTRFLLPIELWVFFLTFPAFHNTLKKDGKGKDSWTETNFGGKQIYDQLLHHHVHCIPFNLPNPYDFRLPRLIYLVAKQDNDRTCWSHFRILYRRDEVHGKTNLLRDWFTP